VSVPCELDDISNVSAAVSNVDHPGMGITGSGAASVEAPDVVIVFVIVIQHRL
jgi:hypothetical protein